MTLRMPGVQYVGPPDANYGGTIRRPPKGQVTHIAEGSFQGTISWQRNPVADVSSYFIVSYAGEIVQMLDLDIAAWTQSAGNPDWIGVENEGFHTDQFTDAQVTANAEIFRWLRSVYPSIPAQVTNSPSIGGLGWHGMGGAAWGGHTSCPGTNNVALLPEIVRRSLGATPTPPTQEDDVQVLVRFSDAPEPNQVWLTDGMRRRVIPRDWAWGSSVTDGIIGNNGVHNAGMLGNLGNSGQVAVSIWSARDAWGVEESSGGEGGLTPHTHTSSTTATTSVGGAVPV